MRFKLGCKKKILLRGGLRFVKAREIRPWTHVCTRAINHKKKKKITRFYVAYERI